LPGFDGEADRANVGAKAAVTVSWKGTNTMRRLFLSLLCVSWLAIFAGCQSTCNQGCDSGCGRGAFGGRSCSTTHGVCDCAVDEHCSSRAPWIRMAPPVVLGGPIEAVPVAPAKALPKPGLE